MEQLKGIHHVTAITGNAAHSLQFYSELLGRRLVKKTVNFADPGSYHLYYGDRLGTPGTLITFFVWAGAGTGHRGTSEPVSLTYEAPTVRITDPDGIQIELAENANLRATEYWSCGNVPPEFAIRSIPGLTLAHRNLTNSAGFYTDQLHF